MGGNHSVRNTLCENKAPGLHLYFVWITMQGGDLGKGIKYFGVTTTAFWPQQRFNTQFQCGEAVSYWKAKFP